MTPEQKQRIAHEISNWRNARNDHSSQITGDRMADLLQELIEAPADVARLDWLVASDWYIGPEYGADEAGGIVGYDNKNIDGLRAAIDAAMSEKGGA